MTTQNLLSRYYGFGAFRPGQEEVIRSILGGRDTQALMPTGGGQSLCYQLPALVFPGITLVISPLIALMKDQVDVLQKRGIAASFVNSSLPEKEIKKRTQAVVSGKIKILYLAPERLESGFGETLKRLSIDFAAIDEAHCVSTWGHDFRPDYRMIRSHLKSLPRYPTVAAFTATATPEVKRDIIEQLGLREPQVFVRGFDRPNLRFYTRAWLDAYGRDREVVRLVKRLDKPGIIYVGKRDKAEELAVYLSGNGVGALPYHAGMPTEKRTAVQEMFMEGKVPIIVATIAFGMGVDKADIRFVIHAGMPGTLEGYYQESGRAGRDGEPATCVLLHSEEDSALQHYFIRKNYEESLERGKPADEAYAVREIKYQKLRVMEQYATARECRRKIILDYFDDPSARTGRTANCGGCDFCLGGGLESI